MDKNFWAEELDESRRQGAKDMEMADGYDDEPSDENDEPDDVAEGYDEEQEPEPDPEPEVAEVVTAEMEELIRIKVDGNNYQEVIRKGNLFAPILDRAVSGMDENASKAAGKPITYVGRIAIMMKAALKREGESFTEWVERAFPNIGIRAVQGYMKIAKIPGVYPWTFLGKNRLMKLARHLVGTDGDPIGDLFASLGLDREAVAAMKRDELADTWARVMAKAERNRQSSTMAKKMAALKKGLEAESLSDQDIESIKQFIQGLQDLVAKATQKNRPVAKAPDFGGAK